MFKKLVTIITSFTAFLSHSYGMEVEEINLEDSTKPVIVAPDTGGGGSNGGGGTGTD